MAGVHLRTLVPGMALTLAAVLVALASLASPALAQEAAAPNPNDVKAVAVHPATASNVGWSISVGGPGFAVNAGQPAFGPAFRFLPRAEILTFEEIARVVAIARESRVSGPARGGASSSSVRARARAQNPASTSGG